MQIAIFLYDNFTALDCIGPYEVLSRLPEADVRFVSLDGGVVRADTGALAVATDYSIDQVTDEAAAADPRVREWVAKVHQTTKWTTSVCTGSLILGAAGLLQGLDATSHWASYDRLRGYGANPVAERFVRVGKIITAAGVSAGIDMAIYLLAQESGEDLAQAVQLAIEYDPQPPFDSGAPTKAPAHILELMTAYFAEARAS